MWLFKKKDSLNDEDLALNYFNSGNMSMLGDLFEKHGTTVYGVCLFYFRDQNLAKDAVMQIFEKLITELRKTKIKSFKAWLSFVVRNHCIGELRKKKGKYFLPESYLDFEIRETSFEEEEEIAAVKDDLMLKYMKEGLPTIDEKQRQCLELFYLNGRSYQEIAEHTNFSINEIKSYIQNGKRNLKLLIAKKN